MRKKQHNIDIIIPTYNNEDYTIKCMRSIRLNTKTSYRVIWVDNGSTKESRQKVMKEFLKHKNRTPIWLAKNKGFIEATNLGICETTAKYTMFLNNDTELIPNCIDTLMELMNENSNIGVLGPLASSCDSWQSWKNVQEKLLFHLPDLDLPSKKIAKILKKNYNKHLYKVKMVAFFCTIFKTDVFDKVGLLPTCYELGLGDDDEFCYKVLKYTNYDIAFTASTLCHHYHRTTFKTLFTEEELKERQNKNIELFKSRCFDVSFEGRSV